MQADLSFTIPPIRRARGYRLYDHRGRRYLDLWQNGGHSLLGHRGLHLLSLLKNLMSRGLLATCRRCRAVIWRRPCPRAWPATPRCA